MKRTFIRCTVLTLLCSVSCSLMFAQDAVDENSSDLRPDDRIVHPPIPAAAIQFAVKGQFFDVPLSVHKKVEEAIRTAGIDEETSPFPESDEVRPNAKRLTPTARAAIEKVLKQDKPRPSTAKILEISPEGVKGVLSVSFVKPQQDGEQRLVYVDKKTGVIIDRTPSGQLKCAIAPEDRRSDKPSTDIHREIRVARINVTLTMEEGDSVLTQMPIRNDGKVEEIAYAFFDIEPVGWQQPESGHSQPLKKEDNGNPIVQASPDSSDLVELDIKTEFAGERKFLTMTEGTSRNFHLKSSMSTLLVADETLLKVQEIGGDTFNLKALDIGVTEIVMSFENGETLRFTVRVEPDTREFRMVLDELFPDADIELKPIRQSIFLRGTAASVEEIEQITDVAEQFHPTVHNYIKVATGKAPEAKLNIPRGMRVVTVPIAGYLVPGTYNGLEAGAVVDLHTTPKASSKVGIPPSRDLFESLRVFAVGPLKSADHLTVSLLVTPKQLETINRILKTHEFHLTVVNPVSDLQPPIPYSRPIPYGLPSANRGTSPLKPTRSPSQQIPPLPKNPTPYVPDGVPLPSEPVFSDSIPNDPLPGSFDSTPLSPEPNVPVQPMDSLPPSTGVAPGPGILPEPSVPIAPPAGIVEPVPNQQLPGTPSIAPLNPEPSMAIPPVDALPSTPVDGLGSGILPPPMTPSAGVSEPVPFEKPSTNQLSNEIKALRSDVKRLIEILEKRAAKNNGSPFGETEPSVEIVPEKGEVVLFVKADWCGACQKMLSDIRRLQSDFPNLRVVDLDQNRQIAGRFNVDAVPMLITVRDGKILPDYVRKGVMSANEISDFLDGELVIETEAISPLPIY